MSRFVLTMRIFAGALIMILCSIYPAVQVAGNVGALIGSYNDEHSHRCIDLRIKLVRVSKVDESGFEYEDLEDNSIGIPDSSDHRWEFSERFQLAKFRGDQVAWLDRHAVKSGMIGMGIYCARSGCNRLLVLQLVRSG